jgi:tetratricopeptide (TPR) repeat protein
VKKLNLEPIFEQVLGGDPVGAAYRLEQLLGDKASGKAFYEVGSQALARRDELGEESLRFARLVFATAVERDPAMGDAQHDLATTMRELGMAQDAIPHYLQALELMPGDLDSIVGLGAAQCDAGMMDEGIATLRRACEAHPDSGHAHANLGVALEKGNRDEEACSAYAKAIVRFDAMMMDAKDDDTATDAAARRRWSRIQLAQILERLERWPQAVVEFRRLYEEERALADLELEGETEDAEAEGDEDEPHADGADDGLEAEVVGADGSHHGQPHATDGAFLTDELDEEHLLVAAGLDDDDDPNDGDPNDDDGDDDEDDEDDSDEEQDELDDDNDAGRLGLERLFTQLVENERYDLAYLVLDDLGGELADSRTRATYAIYDAGDGFPQILMEKWDDGARQRFDPARG